MPIRTASLSRLFRPGSVAIIGASSDPLRIGGRPLHYLKKSGFSGAIYPVNPSRAEIQGLPAFARIADVPGPVDLAIIALPAEAAVTEAKACAAAGVGAAIIFSADFAETGEDGRRRQAELSAIAGSTSMRILGPNCLGAFNANIGLYCTFSSTIEEAFPRGGRTAIVSQSGGYGSHMYVVARNRGVDVSYWITTGNECDIEIAECLHWAAEQPDIDVIMAYAEGVRSGARLAAAFAAAKRSGKKVLILKAGKSVAGSAAVSTHTAAMTGSDDVYDAMFHQFGVARLGSTEEMVDAAYICSRAATPENSRIGLVSISGAMGVQMADAAEAAGLEVTEMPVDVQARLKQLTPFASPRNPVDITAQAFNDLTLVEQNLTAILATGLYGSLISFFTVTAAAPAMADRLFELLASLPGRYPKCLQILSIVGPPEITARYEAAGYLVFEEPVRAIRAIAAALRAGSPAQIPNTREQPTGTLIPTAADIRMATQNEITGKELLASIGIPVPAGGLAAEAEAAVVLADRIGYPVAVKIVSPDILHKTEVGGVALNIADAAALRAACGQLRARAQAARPAARIEGFLVERMAAPGLEAIVGCHRDPTLGPVIMFGLGGVQAEIYRDVSLRLAPVDEAEARRMILEVRARELLTGFRGRPAVDIAELARIIAALSRLAAERCDLIESIDINPLIVHPAGQGATAVDALIIPVKEGA